MHLNNFDQMPFLTLTMTHVGNTGTRTCGNAYLREILLSLLSFRNQHSVINVSFSCDGQCSVVLCKGDVAVVMALNFSLLLSTPDINRL